jgi:hypothetical protein
VTYKFNKRPAKISLNALRYERLEDKSQTNCQKLTNRFSRQRLQRRSGSTPDKSWSARPAPTPTINVLAIDAWQANRLKRVAEVVSKNRMQGDQLFFAQREVERQTLSDRGVCRRDQGILARASQESYKAAQESPMQPDQRAPLSAHDKKNHLMGHYMAPLIASSTTSPTTPVAVVPSRLY